MEFPKLPLHQRALILIDCFKGFPYWLNGCFWPFWDLVETNGFLEVTVNACTIQKQIRIRNIATHGAFLGTFRFVGLYKKVLYTTV